MKSPTTGWISFRVNGVAFATAVFLNPTRDHLDYHGDMAPTAPAKARLFHGRACAATR